MKTVSQEEFKKMYGEVTLGNFANEAKNPGYLSRVKKSATKGFLDIGESAVRGAELMEQGKPVQGAVRSALGAAGGTVRAIFSPVTEAVAPVIREGIEKTGVLEKEGTQKTIASLDTWAKAHPDAAANLMDTLELAGVKGATAIKNAAVPVVQRGVQATVDATKAGAKNTKQKLVDFVAPDADDATKTIIKRSTNEDIDKFVKIQERASVDTEAITPYEAIGDTMANATKQLEKQRKALAVQKSGMINKAKNGLEDFSKPTREAILNIQRSIKNDPIANTFIAKLKTVKNKAQADKVIDDLQDILYRGNQDKTIPMGSAVDKQLKGIIGKYNGALKDSLPTAYRNLNTKIANRTKVINSLNKALGEVVDGVSTRGGSLVKQFFSPNGRKAKELFEYIKKNTGVDLAKDATLARYVMELYGDTRAKTLLGGDIPTSVSGITNKVVDFAVEKTGVGRAMQEAQRRGAIRKAKQLTQPK